MKSWQRLPWLEQVNVIILILVISLCIDLLNHIKFYCCVALNVAKNKLV